MTVFWPGLLVVFAMYGLVFLVGVWAGRQGGSGAASDGSAEELLLAGRSLPLWVGLLTMTATWVGGGYINGTAEQTFSRGLLWGSQAGVGYSLSLLVGGLFYARVMRRAGYATMVDPLEIRYGRWVAALLMVPAVLAELIWSAAILVALGTTFGTVIGVDLTTSILVSSAVAIAYTMFGGLRAVAYTDVVQLFLILVGLGLAIPYAVAAAGGLSALPVTGLAPKSVSDAVSYGDYMLLLVLGGIPWNIYFQRVLAAKTEDDAANLSLGAAVLCGLMAIPPLLLGLAGQVMDWSALGVAAGLPADQLGADLAASPALILPYALRYAVPTWVGVIGLGAVAAAVMASVDSSILSAATLAVWNGYKQLVDPDVAPAVLTRLVRALVLVFGVSAAGIALSVTSVSALWYLCGDLVYCILFPQLTLALFDRRSNWVGALAGLAVSVFLRVGGGDATIGIPALLPYPSVEHGEFPFRTLAMASGLAVAWLVSRATAGYAPPRPLTRAA